MICMNKDFSVDDDPLCQQDIDLVYYWWKLAGGDLRSVLSKAGLLLNRPPITKLAKYKFITVHNLFYILAFHYFCS